MGAIFLVAYVWVNPTFEKRYVILDASDHLSIEDCRREAVRMQETWQLPVPFRMECEEEL